MYLCNITASHVHPPLGVRDYLGLALYAGSFLLEVAADYQKSAWKKAKERKEHDEEFISSGLWSISRHPKCVSYAVFDHILIVVPQCDSYVGEVGIWTGIWVLSSSSLQSSAYPRGTAVLAAISPLFIYLLLRKVVSTLVLLVQYISDSLRHPVCRLLSALPTRNLHTIQSTNNTRSMCCLLFAVFAIITSYGALSLSSGHGDRQNDLVYCAVHTFVLPKANYHTDLTLVHGAKKSDHDQFC